MSESNESISGREFILTIVRSVAFVFVGLIGSVAMLVFVIVGGGKLITAIMLFVFWLSENYSLLSDIQQWGIIGLVGMVAMGCMVMLSQILPTNDEGNPDV